MYTKEYVFSRLFLKEFLKGNINFKVFLGRGETNERSRLE